jgi:hypothetical protein
MTATREHGGRKTPAVDRRRPTRRKGLPPPVEILDDEVARSLLGGDERPAKHGPLEGALDDWQGIDDRDDVPDEPTAEPDR